MIIRDAALCAAMLVTAAGATELPATQRLHSIDVFQLEYTDEDATTEGALQ